MPETRPLTLEKNERICSTALVEQIFKGGKSRSMSAFPLRMVYTLVPRVGDEPRAKMMVSVPKRCFKRAVKRNRVKRQVREAYRHNKYTLIDRMQLLHPDETVAVAFVCIDNSLHPTEKIAAKVENLLNRLCERL